MLDEVVITCKSCDVTKPTSEFTKRANSPTGFYHLCKPCKRFYENSHREKNKDRRKETERKTYYRNREKYLARDAKKRSTQEYKEKQAFLKKKWVESNRDKVRADCAKRRAAKLSATPCWANFDEIEEFYKSAQGLNMLLGEWHHVDHIVPLISDKVCGLHVATNLQILSRKENLSKNNKWWPDMWEPLLELEENHVRTS